MITRSSWQYAPIELEFKFAGVTLFRTPLKAFTNKKHFTALADMRPLSSATFPGDPRAECFLIPSCPLEEGIPTFGTVSGYLRYSAFDYFHYYIEMYGTFRNYLQKFRHKARYKLLRTVRLYNQFCASQQPWKEYCSGAEVDEFCRLAWEVSQKSCQERLLNSGFPRDAGFVGQMKQLAARGAMSGFVLFHGQKPVAYIYCTFSNESVVNYAAVGYDPAYRRWSPGRVLLYYAIKRFFDRGLPLIFDFTRGGEPGGPTEFFSNNKILCTELFYFKWNVKNILVVSTHVIIRFMSERFTSLLAFLRIRNLPED